MVVEISSDAGVLGGCRLGLGLFARASPLIQRGSETWSTNAQLPVAAKVAAIMTLGSRFRSGSENWMAKVCALGAYLLMNHPVELALDSHPAPCYDCPNRYRRRMCSGSAGRRAPTDRSRCRAFATLADPVAGAHGRRATQSGRWKLLAVCSGRLGPWNRRANSDTRRAGPRLSQGARAICDFRTPGRLTCAVADGRFRHQVVRRASGIARAECSSVDKRPPA